MDTTKFAAYQKSNCFFFFRYCWFCIRPIFDIFCLLFIVLMLSIHILVFFIEVCSVSECHTRFTLIPFWTGETKVEERIENLSVLEKLNSDSLFVPRHASVHILYILDTDKKGSRYLFRQLAL